MYVAGLLLLAFVLIVARFKYGVTSEPKTESTNTTSVGNVVAQTVAEEHEVVRKECDTPCSADIEWPFTISKSGGRSLVVTFPGMAPQTFGSGGATTTPRVTGETYFASVPGEPPVHVKVKERVTVQVARR